MYTISIYMYIYMAPISQWSVHYLSNILMASLYDKFELMSEH